MISLCRDWDYLPVWSDSFLNGEGETYKTDIPHNMNVTKNHYTCPSDYTGCAGYRRIVSIPEKDGRIRMFLQFDGIAHEATVYLNGKEIAHHAGGYTSFRVEITDEAQYGRDNVLIVKVDSSENPEIPPFGYVVDYLCYGGIYREVWLDIKPENYIEDLFVYTPSLTSVSAKTESSGRFDRILFEICDENGNIVAQKESEDSDVTIEVPYAKQWDTENPVLYTCRASAFVEGKIIDTKTESFGFRTAVFKADGFYLNGKKTFLRGLNRHQSYPYIGYAAPESLQRADADILKNELCCNAVRTSHYPQSRFFIDECDRIGLLVFTEIPGWQHIGSENWKALSLKNTEDMILQYRNHPSIILWGVRINESTDDDEFYTKTNEIAHRLDPSRQTSGVRYLEKSSLLEDVYAFNDFSHDGIKPGAKKKSSVTPDMSKAFLISEHNGHMFPTKSFDTWEKRQEHAMRHARVLEAAASSGEHAGCFGWCMFDYQTHRDFGSPDHICYHGVTDMFRNPKLAASFYASQGDRIPVLETGSTMDIGDYPAGNTGEIQIFTNCDEVELYKNGKFVTSFKKDSTKSLPHYPMRLNDTIGCLLETEEGFTGGKEKLIKRCLISAGKYGMANLPLSDKLRLAWAMIRYKMKFEDGVRLFGKYVGNWGGEATVWTFKGKKDGKEAITVKRCPSDSLHIEARATSRILNPTDTYDMALVRIRLLDSNNVTASYAQLPVRLKTEGSISLTGPDTVTAEGGMTGTIIRTTGNGDSGALTIECGDLEPVRIDFKINKEDSLS